MQAHVSLGFAQLPVVQLPDFTTGVFDGMTKNAATFPTPPVTMAALDAANKTLISAVAAASRGRAQFDARDYAQDVVIGILRQLAAYVEDIAKGSEAIITSSGFQYVERGFNPQQPLIKTTIQAIINETSCALLIRLNPQTNAYGYEGKMSHRRWQDVSAPRHVSAGAPRGRAESGAGNHLYVHLPRPGRQHRQRRLERPGESHGDVI